MLCVCCDYQGKLYRRRSRIKEEQISRQRIGGKMLESHRQRHQVLAFLGGGAEGSGEERPERRVERSLGS